MNPIALKEMIPNYQELGFPIEAQVEEEEVHFLGESSSFKFPVIPPPFHNQGNWIISLGKVNRWLSSLCESKGVNVLPGFSAVEVLYDQNTVIGVRTGDKGRDKSGKPKSNFEPGLIIKSKLVIFAEGPRGSLFKSHKKNIQMPEPMVSDIYEEGVKEIIQCAPGSVRPGRVIHTMGYPLKKSIGGTFIYTLPQDRIALGLVAYLDTKDPYLDPHRELQRLKTHPFIKSLIKDGKVVAYGGKTLPAGGWYSLPQLFGKGWMVCGDSANLVDAQKLKGLHLGMKSAMLSAEVAFLALQKNDFTEKTLKLYKDWIHSSFIKKDLYRVRNFHQTLSMGILKSLPLIAIQELTGGRGLFDPMSAHKDAKSTKEAKMIWPEGQLPQDQALPMPDQKLFFDKLSSVYLTGTLHDEDSPNHLKLQNGDVCRTVCEPKYKSPCTHFCPAAVYEMLPLNPGTQEKYLQINFTNCIHCKTCDIKCPFENIEWTVPEGGGGPKYQEM
ncbi:MAG TPA: electron transfer flavoprotein-ubiquinone oxidoreductase [Pseudobdellovibrionaceae bacterium]|nr:electron transfer flavoprotein-ubiquinone oxidoreductase [Pseudobdellovibrionaceae bacterium]